MKQRAILFFFIGIMTGILQAQTLTLKDAGQLFLKQNSGTGIAGQTF